MKALIAAAVLVLFVAAPARAQAAHARMTASATVVAPVTVGPSAVELSAARNGGVDVTRPLAVAGGAPWVLEVVEGASYDRAARRLQIPPRPRDAQPATAPAEPRPVTFRLGDRPASTEPRPVTYVVAMVN
ncbi:hypothetical protein [Longimicrobium sp.]|uniref:hypothetical protein n=1 Tax=Longimicrobium sp. TaxID=2029185 RepID=UPI002E3650BA|nr:hypothetical protein [Longimicrobium sp.]HEX6037868.1 hypothetical protein [Longimicrobium sp.]